MKLLDARFHAEAYCTFCCAPVYLESAIHREHRDFCPKKPRSRKNALIIAGRGVLASAEPIGASLMDRYDYRPLTPPEPEVYCECSPHARVGRFDHKIWCSDHPKHDERARGLARTAATTILEEADFVQDHATQGEPKPEPGDHVFRCTGAARLCVNGAWVSIDLYIPNDELEEYA